MIYLCIDAYLSVWIGIIARVVLRLDSSPCPAICSTDFYPACSESWPSVAAIRAEPDRDGGGGYEGAGDGGVATVFLNKGWSVGNFDIVPSTARVWLDLEVRECQFNLATISWPKLPRLKYFNDFFDSFRIFPNILGFAYKRATLKKKIVATTFCPETSQFHVLTLMHNLTTSVNKHVLS